MKILFGNLLFFCILQNASGQLAGKVISANGQPIPFANVLLLNGIDTTLVKAVLTKEDGAYQIEDILQGKYVLRLSSTGYQTWHSPIFDITNMQKRMDFGTQVMKENTKELGEVIIRSEKPLYQQQPEGTIVNAESSILSKGSSVLQLLERSPGVVINHRDNSISLNGKSGVMIMLNGKLMHLSMEQVVNLLEGMSADDIATIELLTTPPAKYDAEGSAGLINIVLKKNKKQGTNGSASVTAGYGWREKGMGSVHLSRNTKIMNLSGSYTFSHDQTYSDLYITSAQDMPFLGGQAVVLFLDTTHVTHNNHDAAISADIKLNPKSTIGGSITYNRSNKSSSVFTNAGYNVLPDSVIRFTGVNKGRNHWNNLVNSIYFEKVIRNGEKINVSLDYLYFTIDNPYAVQSTFIDKHGTQADNSNNLFSPGQKGFANTTISVGVAKVDYTKQLYKKVKLETGFKGGYTQSTSLSGIQSLVNGIWTSSEQTSNHIYMKEGIGAVYASVSSQLDQSANLSIGARYEYSYNNMDNQKTGENIVSRKLGSFFPGVFFSKKLNDKSDLQLSYTKRISRPSYNDLASYVGYSDPTAVYTGNPFLKPTVTNNIKLGYTYKNYSFSLLFSRDDYPIARYQLTESPAKDILFISPQNIDWQKNITFQTNLPFKVGDWWTMNYSFTGGWRQYKVDYSKYPFQKEYFGYSVNFSESFKMPHNFSWELSGWYNNAFYNGTQKIKGYGVLGTGIKKELKNDGGTFQLSVSDMLRSGRIDIRYGSVTEEAFFIKSHVIVTTESAKSPIIKLTYSRSFGNNKTKMPRSTGSDDEQNRIRKE